MFAPFFLDISTGILARLTTLYRSPSLLLCHPKASFISSFCCLLRRPALFFFFLLLFLLLACFATGLPPCHLPLPLTCCCCLTLAGGKPGGGGAGRCVDVFGAGGAEAAALRDARVLATLPADMTAAREVPPAPPPLRLGCDLTPLLDSLACMRA